MMRPSLGRAWALTMGLARYRPQVRVLPVVPTEPFNTLPPSQVQRGMRFSVADGVFAQIFLTITTGSFVTALLLFMGANDFVLGLISALPVVTQLVQLPAALLIERHGARRTITVWSSLGRLFWLVPVGVLFVPLSTEWRLGLSLLAIAGAWGLLAISSNAWLSWMSDLIPPKLRGRFFGVRSTILALVGLGVIFGGGTLLDSARRSNQTALGFLLFYGLACAAGLASTWFVSRQPEPPFKPAPSAGFRALVQLPLRDRSFRAFILTMTIWGIGVNIGAPFYSAHALKALHVSYQQLATFDMTTAAVSILSQPLWGRWADRVGHRRILMVCMLGASPLAFTWLFATPDSLWLLYGNNILSGIFWPGLALALNNRLMERAPAAGRAGYLAIYSAITGVVAFGASLLGGVLANLLNDGTYPLGPLILNHYQVIFVIAGLTRVGVALSRLRTL
ncbi:MAG TPA: MFS transporter [Chloroflexia bacterium]|nr:MFS transporter [Chloroflexia bacterium]